MPSTVEAWLRRLRSSKKGDHVEFRCKATVRGTTPLSVVIALDALGYVLSTPDKSVPPNMLTDLSEPREMTLEEAMELDIDDGLVNAVETSIDGMFGHDGKLIEPLEEVALAAIDAVYSYHKKYYSREAANPKPSGPV